MKDKPKEAKTEKKSADDDLISFVTACQQAGDQYRRKFKTRWDMIESQIRCEHPADWDDKEDWQTKVFVPQQSKTSETAQAYLDKMLFGQKPFFDIQGVEKRDKEEEGYIKELYENVLDRGGFSYENDFILNEACSGPGTSFLKVLVNPKQTGLNFIWRSAYNILIDPDCGHKLSSAKWIIDEYKKSISEMIEDVKKGESLYNKAAIQRLIDKGQEVGISKSEEALSVIKGFDGTSIPIATEYLNVNLIEFWGCVKKPNPTKDKKMEYLYEESIVVLANSTVVLRNDPNEYEIKPFFSCRVKPRKYDFYALGFCDNTVDLQELTNSMVNLGFDSLKLCSMDIAMIDETKVKDPASIEYRPMAMWRLKGNPNEAVKLGRQGISALGDIMRGVGMLDQIQQEATGVLRQIQGSQELSGSGSETLGEYQAKLAMIDNRFLKIARFIERDYIEPLLAGMFKILFNPKFFNQATVDRIIGLKEVSVDVPNPMTGEMVQLKINGPKLDFQKISQISEVGYDFKAIGMTQFSKSIETLQKLKELMLTVVKVPQLMIISKIDEIYKRVLQAAEIQDYQELIKSDEEIQKIMSQIYGGAQPGQPGVPGNPGQPPVPGQGQMPAVGMFGQ